MEAPTTKLKFHCRTINEKELLDIINSLKPKWSAGYDEIPTRIIKDAKWAILKPLLHVINASLISGVYPDELKISKIIPTFKTGDKTEKSNYRPIAVQPSISKIFEKCMLNQLITYFEVNRLLDLEQHGFRQNRSTITALISFVEQIIYSLDKGEHNVSAFLDLTKAFDSVCHNRLIQKLQIYGVKDRELKWIQSYLEGRKQYVEVRHTTNNKLKTIQSGTKEIAYSVPQGSILGPFLFLAYIGYLPETLKTSDLATNHAVCLYADDISLSASSSTMAEAVNTIQKNITTIKHFLADQNLLLNAKKTTFMKFSCKNLKQYPIITNLDLDFVEETNFLGINMDKNFSWTSHVNKVCHKLSTGIFVIRRLRPFCDIKTLKSIYFSVLHSHITYGIEVYGATSLINLNKILHLQKVAIRLMLNLEVNEHCREHFKQLGIMTIYSMYIYRTILHIKTNEKEIPKQLDSHQYNTRNKKDFQIKLHTKEMF